MSGNDAEEIASRHGDYQIVESLLATADSDLLAYLEGTSGAQKDCSDAILDAMLLAADDDLLVALGQRNDPDDTDAGSSPATARSRYL